MFSKQETFTKSYLGLKSQNFTKAVGRNGNCKFQTSTGLRCALGHLSDKLPRGVETSEMSPFDPDLWGDHDSDLTDDLMAAHDDSYGPDEMQAKLHDVATKHGLEIPQ